VTGFSKLLRERAKERDVRRVCEIDPETHRCSQLEFDQLAASAK
jgi:hypothetical protein